MTWKETLMWSYKTDSMMNHRANIFVPKWLFIMLSDSLLNRILMIPCANTLQPKSSFHDSIGKIDKSFGHVYSSKWIWIMPKCIDSRCCRIHACSHDLKNFTIGHNLSNTVWTRIFRISESSQPILKRTIPLKSFFKNWTTFQKWSQSGNGP